MSRSGAPGSGTAALAYVSILVFQTFDCMIFGRLSFPGARWYVVTVWVPQMVRDEKKFGNHWCRLLTTWKKAHHRIHVKRAIRKIKQCHIFDQNIPVSMLGVLNELWLVWCFSRSNYYFRHCSIKHCFWNFVTSHEVWWQMIKQNILYYNIYWQTWHKQKYLWKLPEIFMTREKQFPTMKSRVVRVLQRLGERYLLSSGL